MVRQSLRLRSGYDSSRLVPYQLFPLDLRWLYYETEGHLLNRPRPEIAAQLANNEFLIIVNEARRSSETKPLLARSAFDLHLFDVGAQGFFAERERRVEQALDLGDPTFHRTANLAAPAWQTLAAKWDLTGDLGGSEAKNLIRGLFRVTLAVGHSPAFQREFRDSLVHDWLHLPIPRDHACFDEAVALGEQVSVLLDPLASAGRLREVLQGVLGPDAARIAQVSSDDGGAVTEEDLRVDVAHFGAAPGGWRPRAPAPAEPWRAEWGATTGDLSLNDRVYLRHIPERVWRYELGGYPVIKKWLGYREARRRDGKPLTLTEKDHLRSIVQRLAALTVLEPSLDRVFERVAADAFTAMELGF